MTSNENVERKRVLGREDYKYKETEKGTRLDKAKDWRGAAVVTVEWSSSVS